MHTSTVIVTPRVLLREGIASLLQNTRYKVVASAAGPAELSPGRCPKGQSTLAIVGIDLQNGNLDEFAESIRLLRSLMPDGKVVLVADTAGRIDLQRVLAFSADAFILNPGSRDALIKILELTFMDQRVFVLGDSMAKTASDSSAKTASNGHVPNSAGGSPSSNSHKLGTNGHTSLSTNGYPSLSTNGHPSLSTNGHPSLSTNGHPSLSPREHQILILLAKGESNKAIARLYNLSEATVKAHLKAILRKTKTHNRTQAAIWAIEQGRQDHFSEHSRGMLTDAAA
jgi:two-component system nitrate/nitrite response regulator NarL